MHSVVKILHPNIVSIILKLQIRYFQMFFSFSLLKHCHFTVSGVNYGLVQLVTTNY